MKNTGGFREKVFLIPKSCMTPKKFYRATLDFLGRGVSLTTTVSLCNICLVGLDGVHDV